MGPEDRNQLPSRDWLSWDIKPVPWAHWEGCQHEYYKSSNSSVCFQDKLLDRKIN